MTSNVFSPGTPSPPRLGPRASVAIMLVAALSPFLLGIDAIVPFFASHQTEWSRVIDERVHTTAAAMPSPKVIFVGGSNVMFGINPPSLAARLGLPVIAYGVNAGVGLDLIVARAESLIAPGDLVVLMPEIAHFRSTRTGDDAIRGDWINLFGDQSHFGDRTGNAVGRFPLRQWIASRERCRRVISTAENRLLGSALVLRSRWRGIATAARPPGPYDIRSIAPEGHNTAPRPGPLTVFKGVPLVGVSPADWERSLGAAGVRRMASIGRQRGVRWVVFPGVLSTAGDPPPDPRRLRAMLQDEQQLLNYAARLGAEPFLPPGNSLLIGPYIFDTLNHLNDEGVKVLEVRLMPALQAITRGRVMGLATLPEVP
ncbi:MAG: hypothetical protein ACKVW3_16930 [Phycisphaerales bacterium]